jgi:stress response protein YsnF
VLEGEPITDGNVDHAMDGPAISDEEHEVTLSEEKVVVGKKAVPKERVRLDPPGPYLLAVAVALV